MSVERIQQFITEQFPLARKRDVRPHDPLLEGGILDSMGVLEVVKFLEEEFDIAVDDDELSPENFHSIENLARFVSQKRDASSGGGG